MSLAELLKLCGVALVCAFAAVLLKRLKGDLSPLLRIGGLTVLLCAVALGIGEVFSELLSSIGANGANAYAEVLFKALGIAFVTKISADICRDLGESGFAEGVGLGGRLAILSLCIPLVGELISYASEMLKLE